MKKQTLIIEGMHCMNSCVRLVSGELSEIDGLVIDKIDVNRAEISIDEQKVTYQQLEEAISEAGFKLKEVIS